ncbi:MAG: sigma-70 family RNA polymerase sigma factor [Acidobacteria bacterium]|nr:sigma-70 family RNA polymerase sigma factor [Acidobacteriota bacterium]
MSAASSGAAGGDREARFDAVLALYGPALRRVASAYEREPARAEDLFQDIALALWEALPRFRGESSERTFVYRVAHNRGVSHALRHRTLRAGDGAGLDEAVELADPEPSPEDRASASQRAARLREAVPLLPMPLRQVLMLLLEGLTPREIGEVLGLTENNVNVRLSRARGALRRSLREGGAA